VTSIRKTIKGDLLVELTKGSKATAATSVIRDKLAATMVGSMITRLRHTADVEITDLDEVTIKDEVLAAILKILNDDDLSLAEEVKITGLWATREGHQMVLPSTKPRCLGCIPHHYRRTHRTWRNHRNRGS